MIWGNNNVREGGCPLQEEEISEKVASYALKRVPTPAAEAAFSGKISRPPSEWAERSYIVFRWTEMPSGATSQPWRNQSCWRGFSAPFSGPTGPGNSIPGNCNLGRQRCRGQSAHYSVVPAASLGRCVIVDAPRSEPKKDSLPVSLGVHGYDLACISPSYDQVAPCLGAALVVVNRVPAPPSVQVTGDNTGENTGEINGEGTGECKLQYRNLNSYAPSLLLGSVNCEGFIA